MLNYTHKMKYNPKISQEIYLALKKLNKEGKLKDYILYNVVPKDWVFAAPSDKRRTLFHKRIGGTSRFAHPQKRVLYLAPSAWRPLLETNQKEKHKQKVIFFEFYKSTSKDFKPPCLYLINLKKGIKLFRINNNSQITQLNQELNYLLGKPLKNILRRSINMRSNKSYFLSQCLADSVSRMGFDGILYKIKTPFYGNHGPVVGSLNNSMIVIFEKISRKHVILNVPLDEENLECATC